MTGTAATDRQYAYVPTPAQVQDARVTHLMNRLGVLSIDALRDRASREPAWFWAAVIDDLQIPFTRVPTAMLDDAAGPEWSRWFVGGQINLAAACVDRWADDPRTAAQPALIAEREDGTVRRLSFRELALEVHRASAALRELGVGPGASVGLLLPAAPEAVIATYAIAKVGAMCVPIFSGLAATVIASRLDDAGCRVVICADGTVRHGQVQVIKPLLDAALDMCSAAVTTIVVERLAGEAPRGGDRELSWATFLDSADAARGRHAEPTSSEHPFLLAYTSGATGRAKGAVHVHGGFLVRVASQAAYSLDVGRGDRLLWAADPGEGAGPWSAIGAHVHGACVVLLDAAPDHPTPARVWEAAERHRVTHLGVSPALTRALRGAGDEHARGHDLSALRIVGAAGEPWDAASYGWLMDIAGGARPIISVSGGSEVGAGLLAPYPVEPLKTGSFGGPCLGMAVDVFDDAGRPVRGAVGELVGTRPWPGMTRGLWGDSARYLETYWSRFPGVWSHGDRALIDEDGQWFLVAPSDPAVVEPTPASLDPSEAGT